MQVRPPRACRGGANAGPLVALTARDKQGCSIGFIDLEVKGETEEAGSSQASKAVYFHSAPSASGFKHAGTGTVQSAGLELMRGDQLSDLRLKHGKKGDYVVVDGALVECAHRAESVYADNLDGLCDALGDAELRDGAQHTLCHGRACAAVWTALAVFESLLPKIVRVIELLVKCSGGGTSKRTATSALQHLLLSGVTLPPASPLYGLLCRKGDEDDELRTRFVQAMCSAWPVTPQARRRCFVLLQALGQHHPARASALLSFDMMMKLLSVTLPGGDHISCYHWRELPLKLLPSETVIQSSGAAAQQAWAPVLSSRRPAVESGRRGF